MNNSEINSVTKIALVLLFLSGFFSVRASANDGGIAAIKVNSIKVREVQVKEGVEKVVKSHTKPNFRILIDGPEAVKLQKILPSQFSVITAIQPEIADAYNESFKTLGVYSGTSREATAKTITISCDDADLQTIEQGEQVKFKVVKNGKPKCVISISGADSEEDARESMGDVQKYEPPVCR